MLKITKSGPNRLDLEFQGKITTEDMQEILDEFITLSKEIEHGKILYTIYDFDFPSMDAIMVKLSRLPELFGLLKRFDRMAILTNKTWLQKIAQFEGFLVPGLEIKAFDLDEIVEAEAWLSGQ
ncbi:STAS/SEC14 domain-containing protein [Sulfurovum sp. NBC37-1]|uniref:STAS/SEC14 domain-containing protein n=1 Tax=Sulfurovum sp. (strain NBC37-1) TaxID=387093 RepID=UPI0001587763|nr:STAS/SEC14 domain-containing protein [Sulfurovum sp. NBC37-1]BAF71616.1 conserved hypothetical protein [Sulfurovum sp. NBC37-1]